VFKLFKGNAGGGAEKAAPRADADAACCAACGEPLGAAAAHASPAMDLIERTCAASEEKDPLAIAHRLLHDPALKRHGPEHDFLVPAVLVAAFSNARGEGAKRAERVAEARRRSDPAAGGFCGKPGGCGPAAGAGTFVAIVTGEAKPRGLADKLSKRALAVIGKSDGTRCCRRDSKLAILAAVKFANEHLDTRIPTRVPSCEWSATNRDCVGAGCPFNR
jgi:hypothetical protein